MNRCSSCGLVMPKKTEKSLDEKESERKWAPWIITEDFWLELFADPDITGEQKAEFFYLCPGCHLEMILAQIRSTKFLMMVKR